VAYPRPFLLATIETLCHVDAVSDEIQASVFRTKKFWIITGIAVVGLAVLAAGARWGRPLYRHFKEVRNLKQARTFLEKGDMRNGVLSLRATLAANPANLEATRRMAELVTEAQSPAALGWWRRVVELSPTTENRVILASTALRAEKPPFPILTQTLDELQKSGAETNVAYHLVASQYALRVNSLDTAVRHLATAAQLEPTNRLHQLNLATLRLQHTNTTVATRAREELAALASDAKLGEHALRSLTSDSLAHKRYADAEQFSQRLLALPPARFDDRLQHLTILSAAKSPQTNAWLAQVQQEAATNAIKAGAIAGWMNSRAQSRAALDWLNTLSPQLRTNAPLPIAAADCYLTLRDWAGLDKFLADQDWDEQEPIRQLLLARTAREQGRRDLADAQWRRALGAASVKGDLLGLIAQTAASWGWISESEEALWALVKRSPWQDWAWQALLQARNRANDTAGLYRVYSAMLDAKPDAPLLKNNVAALGLLLGRDVEKCARLAREVYLVATNSGLPVSTHAYALHLQGKTAEALRMLETLPEKELQRPSVAAYYAILLSAAGQQEKARPFVELAEKGQLLPEEKRLLDTARSPK